MLVQVGSALAQGAARAIKEISSTVLLLTKLNESSCVGSAFHLRTIGQKRCTFCVTDISVNRRAPTNVVFAFLFSHYGEFPTRCSLGNQPSDREHHYR